MVTSYLKWIIRGVMCITMTSINNNERSTAFLLLYIEFCTRISKVALLELKVARSHKEKEERVEMEARPVYIFEFGITLEQLELADVEAEVQPRGCYV
jgi:hypothetical protein